jgi:hypothetical protein
MNAFLIHSAVRRPRLVAGALALGLAFVLAAGTQATADTTAIDDTTPPTLASFSFTPQSVDVTSTDAIVTITMRVTDDLSGVDFNSGLSAVGSYAYLQTAAGNWIYIPVWNFTRVDANTGNLDTTWQGEISIAKSSALGDWHFVRIAIVDNVGNSANLMSDAIQALGVPALAVTSTQDNVAPNLLSFGFVDPADASVTHSTAAVDVSSGPAQVTVRCRISDNLSGVDPGNCWIQRDRPATTPLNILSTAQNPSLVSGTEMDGIYEATIYIPQYFPSGVVPISVWLHDRAGNQSYFGSVELSIVPADGSQSAGWLLTSADLLDVYALAVKMSLAGDHSEFYGKLSPDTQQALQSFIDNPDNADPGTIDVAARDALVVLLVNDLNRLITGEWIPDWAGFDWEALCSLTQHLWSEASMVRSGDMLARFNRSLVTDIFPGLITPLAVHDSGLTVTSTPCQVNPPQAYSVMISKVLINTSMADATVRVVVDAKDDPSGLNGAWVTFMSPSGGQYRQVWCSRYNPDSTQPDPVNNPLRWRLAGDVKFPQYSEAGTWHVATIEVYDYVYVVAVINTSQPENAEFRATLNVIRPSLIGDGSVDDTGATITDDAFGDRASIVVPPGAVTEPTTVAIDVLSSSLDVPSPTGYVGGENAATYYVNIHFDPEPAFPLPSPGLTVTLPLRNALPPGTSVTLFRINESSGLPEPATSVSGGPVQGIVDTTGLAVTFTGISRLSTVVGLLASPQITWANPADIVYGTPLSSTQLNATAGIAGTFTYTPAAGTVLNAGPGQTLSVTFTPTDTASYPGTYTGAVTINVTKAPLVITAANATMVAGDPIPAFTATYQGFVGTDGPASLTSPPVLQAWLPSPSTPGTYDITVSGAASDNYAISYVNGTLTVLPKTSVTFQSAAYPSVSSRRISATVWEYTMKYSIKNTGDGNAHAVSATLNSVSPLVTVVQGAVSFGDIAAGKVATSTGTFVIRMDRTKAVTNSDLTWSVTYTDDYGATASVVVPYN